MGRGASGNGKEEGWVVIVYSAGLKSPVLWEVNIEPPIKLVFDNMQRQKIRKRE